MRRASILILLLVIPFTLQAKEAPYLGGRVNDLAKMLDADVVQDLEDSLQQLETDTGAQLVVLTVQSLEGDVLEDFALRVAETWQLGRKDHDDGVLILIAKSERKIRIEVGYGLEGAIPDVKAKRIIDGIMQPRFKEGDFNGGISEAAGALAGLIRGEAVELPEDQGPSDLATLLSKIFTAFIFFVIIGIFSVNAIFAKGAGSWILYFFLMPFYGAFPIAIFGPLGALFLIAWIVGFPVLRTMTWHTDWGRSFRTTHPGWVKFATSSGGSGGGFSGGGGSFGGGGASGGW